MNKEYAWVIQRYDGKYPIVFDGYGNIKETSERLFDFINMFIQDFCVDFKYLYRDKSWCEAVIDNYNLQNCKPVKVEIKVIGEENE